MLKTRVFTSTNANKLQQAVEKFLELYEKNSKIMCLFSTNEMTNKFNKLVSSSLKLNIHCISAIDTNENHKLNYKNINYKKKRFLKSKKKTSQTAGLETVLELGVGSRVMLKKNIDVDNGLCNGALGIVTDIGFNANNSVDYITVKLDSTNEEVEIKRVVADYEYQKNCYVSRSQFPLSNAWALTIHKSQGITLDQVMIDLATTFENGMGYVALSRAKKLESVFLIDFDAKSLFCEKKCVIEYNRLREKFLGIKPIQIYNSIPEFESKLQNKPVIKELLSDFEKLQLNILDIQTNNSSNTKKNSKNIQKQNPVTATSNDNYFFKLNNFNNACFANVILQAFLAYGDSFFNLVFESINDPKGLEFYNIFNTYYDKYLNRLNTNSNANNLRSYASNSNNTAGDNFVDGTQQDCFSFFNAIFDKWPEIIKEKFRFQSITTKLCACGNSQIMREHVSHFINLARTQQAYIKFNDLLNQINYEHCFQCQKITKQTSTTNYIFEQNHKFLLIRLQNTNIANGVITELNSEIIDYDIEKIVFNANIPSQFRIVSAIVYIRGSISNNSGHYIIWVRKLNNNGWFRISDSISRSYNNLIKNLKNVYLLFLERI